MPAPRLFRLHCLVALGGVLLPFAAWTAVPLAPNAAGGAQAAGRCPAFEWRGDGAAGVEIEVYRVAADAGKALEGPVLQHTITGPATRWSAAGGACLAAGTHAWSVRSLPDGAWSDPLLFDVAGPPSDEELEAAIAVIEQYLAQRGERDTDAGAKPPLRGKGAGGITAVQGLVPDVAGTTRGVHGTVASPAGVGVLAENAHPAGFDLQLAGPVPAQVNEREWRLDAATPQTVNFTNPSGAMSVLVQGQPLITAETDQNTTYSAGNQLALASTTFNVVEGAGSGLDADTVDGLNAADLAGVAHTHAGQVWTSTQTSQSTLVGISAALVGAGLEGRNSVGAGLIGTATASSGSNAIGVRATTQSTLGIGVSGSAFANSGATLGILGLSESPAGAGGLFLNNGGGLLLAASNASTPTLAGLEFSVDNDGDVVAKSYAGNGQPLTGVESSMFRTFGGDGSNGALVVSGATGIGVRRQYTTLTINAGAILDAGSGDGRSYIAVQGRCTIRGTINARGFGALGPLFNPTGTSPGLAGRDAFDRTSRVALPNCVSGAGGAGGRVVDVNGGNGGGAESDGGLGSSTGPSPGGASSSWKRLGISGGGFGVRDSGTGHAGYAAVLACPGAGGGTGATVNADGINSNAIQQGRAGFGGGVVYLECGELELTSTGIIDARGTDGWSKTCTGPDCAIRDGVGGDGGGGGGVVLIRTRQIIAQSGQILVDGGAGGAGAGFMASAGGAGASGYADILIVD